jgi:quercetin dioxygenase-like cupin family protein
MKIQLPHTITNPTGETLIFHELIKEPDGDKIVGENFVMPNSGPPMHVHWLQDEGFTVIKGKIGYQILGQPEQFASEGESVVFKRGEPHRFWNAGDEVLNCKGWLKPANTIVYFLSAIFNAQNKSGSSKPELFDAAYLLTRYKSEYDMLEIPAPVKKIVFPVVCALGKLLGKYKHFKDAPAAVKKR